MTTKKSYFGTTVMLDEGRMDYYCEGAGRKARLQTAKEIERRVYTRFPKCKAIWLRAYQMGTYKAEHPSAIECPDDIYEAVLS
jgi:hypothetical protein